MKLSRDLSGGEWAKALARLGYTPGGEHHVIVHSHKLARTGTLAKTLLEVARHPCLSRQEPLEL